MAEINQERRVSNNIPVECDVLVIGSGAGGMLAANRAHDLGLRAVVIEGSDRYGGTSALSGGGIWIPCNRDIGSKDSRENTLTYLRACSEGRVDEAKLSAYVDNAAKMIEYLGAEVGTPCRADFTFADYAQRLPGASDAHVVLGRRKRRAARGRGHAHRGRAHRASGQHRIRRAHCGPVPHLRARSRGPDLLLGVRPRRRARSRCAGG